MVQAWKYNSLLEIQNLNVSQISWIRTGIQSNNIKNTRDQKMIADLMHARIDLQKNAIPEKYGNRCQLGNSIRRIDRQNVLETAPIEAP
jgi:hypothetical protein